MRRRTRTITFSLPPEMAVQVEEMKNDEGRTTSELMREALRCYMGERERKRLQNPQRIMGEHTFIEQDLKNHVKGHEFAQEAPRVQ